MSALIYENYICLCGKSFKDLKSQRNSSNVVYCSKICHKLFCIQKLKMLRCCTCYQYFIRPTNKVRDHKKRHGDTPQFCSKDCFNLFQQPFSRGYRYCEWCNKRFTLHTKIISRENKGITCSLKCRKFYEKNVDLDRVAWNRGQKLLPHVKHALRSGHKKYLENNDVWNKGVPHTEKHKMKLRIARKDRIYPYVDTKPEVIMQKALRLNNIEFSKHKSFALSKRFHRVDIFIEPNICVEVDGNYWHKLPERIERDKFVNSELKSQGMKVYRFWESDIKKDVQTCIQQIKN